MCKGFFIQQTHYLNWKYIRRTYRTAQKMKFFFKDFFSKCDQIRKNLPIGHIYWRNP